MTMMMDDDTLCPFVWKAKLAHNPKGCAGASKFELRLKLIMDQAPFDKRDAGRGSGNRLEMDWTWDCSPPFSLILEG